MSRHGATRVEATSLSDGDWVERRYGYGEARWGRITGRAIEGHDCWVVASINGSVYRDNGRDLTLTPEPVHADSEVAVESRPDPRRLPEWVDRLRDQ